MARGLGLRWFDRLCRCFEPHGSIRFFRTLIPVRIETRKRGY